MPLLIRFHITSLGISHVQEIHNNYLRLVSFFSAFSGLISKLECIKLHLTNSNIDQCLVVWLSEFQKWIPMRKIVVNPIKGVEPINKKKSHKHTQNRWWNRQERVVDVSASITLKMKHFNLSIFTCVNFTRFPQFEELLIQIQWHEWKIPGIFPIIISFDSPRTKPIYFQQSQRFSG